MVAIVIPAYNEEHRIGGVLRAALASKLANEVIVVNDASRDNTSAAARAFPGVKVIDLKHNKGKGGAMAVGVDATKARTIMFLDADLVGLQAHHIDSIIQPVMDGNCDMCVGIFRGGKFWSDTAQRISPLYSGQRALKRELFERIPFVSEIRMGVEVTINAFAKRSNSRVHKVIIRGVSNTHKERKMGVVRGTAARAKMYSEMYQAIKRTRRNKMR